MSPTATHPTLQEMAAGLSVTSTASKLIFVVPAGPVVTFPEGAKLSGYGQNDENPVVVVYNGTDGTWQGADADGIIIMNSVDPLLAGRLLEMYKAGHSLAKIIATAEAADHADTYTTNKEFVDEHLSPVDPERMIGDYTGRVVRLARDTATVARRGDVFYVAPPGSDGSRVIQPEILVRDYVEVDGSPINLKDVPEV